jgi:hypothetical protein
MLHGRQVCVRKARSVGGIILLLGAAATFGFGQADGSVPAAIALTGVGVAMVATARRGGTR